MQIFVEDAGSIERPDVVVNPSTDPGWNDWEWMKRFRIWQDARQVFLYPENLLATVPRPNRTEIYQKLEQEVRQAQSTDDYLQTVVLNYIDWLDQISNLLVTGYYEDEDTGATYVVARSNSDPPRFYWRSLIDSAWSGWEQIPLNIKARQRYRRSTPATNACSGSRCSWRTSHTRTCRPRNLPFGRRARRSTATLR